MTKLSFALAMLIPALAVADDMKAKGDKAPIPAKADPKPMPAKVDPKAAMPAPPAEVKATVDAFKGNWKFDISLMAPGMEKAFTGKMTFNCKAIAAGNGVSCDSKAKTPMGPFEGTFVIAYDPYSKAVHFIGITSQFEVHDHVCKWTTPADLNCNAYKGGMGPGGDEISEDLSMKWDKGTVAFTSTSTMKVGGGKVVFEGKGKK